KKAASELGAEVVDADAIYDVECDVFSPNSIGGVINDDTIARLRCKAVAGGANNILAEPRLGEELMQRGIVYAPDYLVNSGGLIRCQEEVFGRPTEDFTIYSKVTQIFDQTLQVIELAEELGISTAAAADWMAEERIAAAR
ncbi:MAG: leucine dehydrogenase, partial [Gemmatimonadetes bacterium]|nr:leucine dehydrogenase [Gemmatimonadota bacterium]